MPETARHLILGGAQGASGGGVPETSAAYWLAEFAEDTNMAAYPYIAVGQSGSLRVLAADADLLAPTWSVGAPLSAWPDLSDEDTFAVWITPETGIQFSAPSVPYANSTQSPLTATLALVDQIAKTFPGTPIVLQEDWANPTPFLLNGVMTKATRKVYFDYTLTTYHQWFETLLEMVQSARPGLDISLVSTASTLAGLASTAAFADLATTLMPDNPADGAEARALLSGAVGFSSSFAEVIPVSTALVEKAAPDLAALFPDLSAAISTVVLGDLPPDPDPDMINVTGTDDADTVTLAPAMVTVDLGVGLDTVLINATFEASTIVFGADGTVYVALPGDSTPAALSNVERLEFQDGTLAFDTDGIAGQAYRLYQASFDRTPDAEGLGFWIDALDGGEINLEKAAQFFMQSEEFEAAYGSPDEVTDVLFLTLLYVNALDRRPDPGGFDYWREQQDQGVTRADMMVYFSESEENIAQVAPAIEDGIWYL
jgi:hypothetical protein